MTDEVLSAATATATVAPGASTGLRVRRAGLQDADALGALVADVYLADGLVPAGSPYLAELRDAARRIAQAHVLVATTRGEGGAEEVVGTITLAAAGAPFTHIARDGEVELRMLAVRHDARGRGWRRSSCVPRSRRAPRPVRAVRC
ncbi:hypothetical protein [Cellulomonas sp. JZ18]|uniref:hypothetical protein n=1 Tax=Cellulomonas sp. JZ18 TaxID=2654191 RepID=UPI001E3784C6|nr:hypothetical protein [Cellulomonas sp. JZ18]